MPLLAENSFLTITFARFCSSQAEFGSVVNGRIALPGGAFIQFAQPAKIETDSTTKRPKLQVDILLKLIRRITQNLISLIINQQITLIVIADPHAGEHIVYGVSRQ